jgi:hypothetical protein
MGLRFTASASRFPDGRLAEVFLDNHKAGSAIGVLVRDGAIVLSFALQHGADATDYLLRPAARRTVSRLISRRSRPSMASEDKFATR